MNILSYNEYKSFSEKNTLTNDHYICSTVINYLSQLLLVTLIWFVQNIYGPYGIAFRSIFNFHTSVAKILIFIFR